MLADKWLMSRGGYAERESGQARADYWTSRAAN